MNFLTPCFVRVENVDEQIALKKWLRSIGQEHPAVALNIVFSDLYFEDHYDCGTNVELFKALAAMNDSNDREQWFITDQDEWFVSGYDDQYRHLCNRTIDGVKIGPRTVRKATTEEIVEHFKNQTT